MDFSTIKKKITQDEYSNINEFRSDFELMCDNAMKYNRPETVYYQAGKKLLSTGIKLMTKDKLINLRRTVECFSRLTERELGFHFDVTNHNNNTNTTTNNNTNDEQIINSHEQMDTTINDQDNRKSSKLVLKLPRYYEKLPTLLADEEDDEELSPEEILSQAQQAAKCPREKLSLRRPISAYKLTCQRTNGTTSLRFINQDDLNQQQQSQTRIITIGELSNMPSSAGAPSSNAYHPHPTPIVNENEKRNHLLPRYFLDYGPFSSHAPQYDSSFSSISKDELDLLIHTYGSEFSAQNAVSLIDYVKDSGDLSLTYVDKFFSEHDNNSPKIQNNLQNQLDMKLDENAKLLIQLRQAQYDRLCQPSNKIHQILSTSSSSQQTTEQLNETDLAEKILNNLSNMTHMSSNGPEQIITPEIIRHNLGVVINNNDTL